jgi:hypothetical protein
MTAVVDSEMTAALDGEPERVRRILSYRAVRSKTDVERAALTEVLERSMGHASARVRMHARRLLRAHADRSRYLAATRPLLRDGDTATVRSAIRVLAFGGDVDSVAEIANLLSQRRLEFPRRSAMAQVVLDCVLSGLGTDRAPAMLLQGCHRSKDHESCFRILFLPDLCGDSAPRTLEVLELEVTSYPIDGGRGEPASWCWRASQ